MGSTKFSILDRHILVTGANGFVGRCLVDSLANSGAILTRVVRNPAPGVAETRVAAIDGSTDWGALLSGIDTVVHLAARVHVMDNSVIDPLGEYRKVNVEGSLHLAKQAVKAGVKRLIYVSSIKVNGEETRPGTRFHPEDPPKPADPYGISKAEAEVKLRVLSQATGLELVIIRPVLVYGPGVKANFLSMMRWLDRGVPLPLGAIGNLRSLVAVENLVDLIRVCIEHPGAANQIFLVSDGEDLSTPELLRRTAAALGRRARLMRVPSPLLLVGASMLGRTEMARRLCSSLQVDISKTRSQLDWTPPFTVDQALWGTARHYLNTCG